MKTRHVVLILTIIALVALGLAENDSETTTATEPLAMTDSTGVAIDSTQAWLRVEVETSWGWFWQKSTGRVYVMVDKQSRQRMKAGKLCARLEAHDITEKYVDNADSLVVIEKKRGLGIPKRTAVVTAWAESPNLEEVSVALEP